MEWDSGELIRLCRKQAGLTIAQLSEKSGVDSTSLWAYENGRYMPRFDKVMWCLKACGFDLELIRIKEKKK